MAISPELEKKTVNEIPRQIPEIPPEVERPAEPPILTGVTTKTASDDTSQTTRADDQTQTVTVQIPAQPSQLETWSKGPPANSLTWFAYFWIRLIKKALHFNWKILMGDKNEAPRSNDQEVFSPLLRREQNPSEAENSSYFTNESDSKVSAKGDKT